MARGRAIEVIALLAAFALGLLLRSLHFEAVFPDDGGVVLGLDDSFFHARRALYSFANFPAVLDFDWYLAYPDGAAAPVPPLFDWGTAGVARLFGSDTRTFETVAAWVSPLAGALLVLPAYAIGRAVASRSVGLVAAGLVVVLPSGILLTRLGNFDHHAVVAGLVACWLATSLSCVGRSGRELVLRAGLLAVVIGAMLFTWSGSLLYLALGAGAQLAGILSLRGRPDALLGLGASLLAAAVPTAVWLAHSAAPLGGSLTSQTLSWLHVLALIGIATPTLLLSVWERRVPSAGATGRFVRFGVLTAISGLPLLALPDVRESLLLGVSFLAKRDEWAVINPEQLPLFHSSTLAALASVRLGYFAYVLPLAPVYLGWWIARGGDREKKLVLAIWVSVLGFLLFSQVRYGTDFTAPGAVVFALVLVELRSGLARRLPGWLASACVATLTAIALFPAINDFHRPSVARAFAEIGAGAVQRQTTAAAKVEVEMRFGERVRQATPETRGFLDSTVRPEYGILVPPTLGHRFAYTARRAVPSNNLGPYLDVEKYRLARSFYRSDSARGALETLEALGVRYVVTVASGRRGARFTHRLHRDHESSIQGRPSSGRLRLVATSGDAPRSTLRDHAARVRHATALKLFEVVSGAVLVVEAEPGSRVTAEIWLRPENGERRLYQTVGLADAEGVARLRVPYATAQQGPVSTSGAWLVRVAGRVLAFQVGEADVHEGREVIAAGEAGEATRAGAVGPA